MVIEDDYINQQLLKWLENIQYKKIKHLLAGASLLTWRISFCDFFIKC